MDKIIKLLDAGFTKDEIMKMVEQPVETAAEIPEPEQTAEPVQAEQPAENTDRISELTEEITSLKKLVQDQNLQARTYGEQPQHKTAADIIAGLIDPRLN